MLEKLIVFFIFFLPFQFALQPGADIDLALARVLAIVIFFWWVAASLLKKHFIWPKPLPLFFFMAFLFWAALSLAWAENPNWALRKLFFLLSFFPLFLVFGDVLRHSKLREKILYAWVSGAFLAALVALAQFFAQWRLGLEKLFIFWTQEITPFFLGAAFSQMTTLYSSLLVNISGQTIMRASGLFPDPHIAALYFGMSLPIALFLVYQNVGLWRPYFIFSAAVIFLADILTFSRGGYLGLILGMVFFLASVFLKDVASGKRLIGLGIFVLIALAVLATPVGTRLLTSFSSEDGSKIERLQIWQAAIELIKLRPAEGVGLGNYPLVVKPSADYREPFYAHNLFLDIAVETGFIGLLFFMVFLLLGILSAGRKWRRDQDFLALAVLSSLTIFTTHSFFETPIFSVHILPIFILLMAMSLVNAKLKIFNLQ